MKTFSIGWILETLAAQEDVNLITEGIDDVCFGMAISSDKTLAQVIRENSAPYNYLIVDGDPIRLVRREVNDALVIDVEIAEEDCIRRDNTAPAIEFTRAEPSTLPRQVEVQYIDPDRDYATATQIARHPAALKTNTQISISLDFVLSAQQALDIAYDLLFRLWAQQTTLQFEHPDIRIEPADVLRVTCSAGIYICIVGSQTINLPARTNTIKATTLLSSKATSVTTAQGADPFTKTAVAIRTEDDVDVVTEDDVLMITEG
jgi:hypothetical protein